MHIWHVNYLIFFSNMLFCYFRLHEFDEQIQWIREGMSQVVPVPLLSIFTGYELETMVRKMCHLTQVKEVMIHLKIFKSFFLRL